MVLRKFWVLSWFKEDGIMVETRDIMEPLVLDYKDIEERRAEVSLSVGVAVWKDIQLDFKSSHERKEKWPKEGMKEQEEKPQLGLVHEDGDNYVLILKFLILSDNVYRKSGLDLIKESYEESSLNHDHLLLFERQRGIHPHPFLLRFQDLLPSPKTLGPMKIQSLLLAMQFLSWIGLTRISEKHSGSRIFGLTHMKSSLRNLGICWILNHWTILITIFWVFQSMILGLF